ncbi:hypothetical protein GCM10023149_17190 [Mucilaginibacter gynuensis]|uniref:DUF3352 domain-containing protein n=1 Tax=Mucilaginibacter gynuensis TaxID=1302236 RepID=A0ABP8G7P7_9SPHI
MKRIIIVTILLLVAAGYMTVAYFKNLSPPGLHTSQVMSHIPGDAAFIFEFSNDNGFDEIFQGNTLLPAVAGKQTLDELSLLREQVLTKTLLKNYFYGQDIFISLHPAKNDSLNLLITIPAVKTLEEGIFNNIGKSNLLVSPYTVAGKKGYTFFVKALNRRFYTIVNNNNILSGSFSKELIETTAAYDDKKKQPFELLPAKQNSNSPANLYVNYRELNALFDNLFKNSNTDIFKSFRVLPATAVLSLNYKSDALLFNGTTTTDKTAPTSYLNLFSNQQPVNNQLKNIFPSTTAYFINFGVADSKKFTTDLADWYRKANQAKEKAALLAKIKNETGVNLQANFNSALMHEFAIVTTRYQEKLGIIAIKDGSKLKPTMLNISTGMSENSGRFNYDKVPYFLLGDAFGIFRKPYFMVIDNYLLLANSYAELESYYETYINGKFLIKMDSYNLFDNLLAQSSNVNFYLNFKNSQTILRRDLSKPMYDLFKKNEPGFNDYYALSYQLTASDKNFYTNFCMKLNPADTTLSANK